MKQTKLLFLMAGFLVGVCYVITCGGGAQSIADAVTDAVDVLFDNSSSGLTATNVQSAIDEVESRINSLESANDFSSLLAGSWTGSESDEDATTTGISLILNSSGTYSCSDFLSSFTSAVCDSPVSWDVENNVLKITYTVPDGFTASGNIFLPVQNVDSSNLALLDGSGDAGMRVVELAK